MLFKCHCITAVDCRCLPVPQIQQYFLTQATVSHQRWFSWYKLLRVTLLQVSSQTQHGIQSVVVRGWMKQSTVMTGENNYSTFLILFCLLLLSTELKFSSYSSLHPCDSLMKLLLVLCVCQQHTSTDKCTAFSSQLRSCNWTKFLSRDVKFGFSLFAIHCETFEYCSKLILCVLVQCDM